MKKLLYLMMPIFAVVTLTACGQGPDSGLSASYTDDLTAFQLLELSHAAQADLGSFVSEVTADIRVSTVGISMEMPLTMTMALESEERARIAMEMTVMGMPTETLMYIRDGYLYSEMDVFGEVIRDVQPADFANDVVNVDMFDTTFLVEEMIHDYGLTVVDGGYRLFFDLNLDGLFSFLDDFDMMEDLFAFDAEEMGEWAMSMVMYLNEDLIPMTSEILLNVETEMMGMPMSLHIDMVMNIVEIGNVVIDFPAWLDEL